jgi:RimJ/RimL family protein N-acetyltransferase
VRFTRLSLETIYRRYFTPTPGLPLPIAERMTHVDYENHMALVATVGTGDDERVIAVVSYERAGPSVAEVAFVVENCWHGRGIATALMYRLADYARECGIDELVAQTMGWNAQMHKLLRQSGFPAVSYRANGLSVIALDISRPPEPAYAKH